MVRWLCVLLLVLPVAVAPSASAEWSIGTGFASFDSPPICTIQSAMAGDVTYQRYLTHEDGYLELVLMDPYCPLIYLQQPLIFHGWMTEEGACFTSSFLLSDATLCLTNPSIVDVALHHFDATLCVDPVSEAWCTNGEVIMALA